MDPNRFTGDKTGRLLELLGAFARDWAFIPDDLPPGWEFPTHLWPLLDEATSAISGLDGAGRHMPNPTLILRPLQVREAVASSSLEGTTTEPEAVLLFQQNPRVPTSEKDRANDWLEVANYDAALKQGYELLANGRPITCEVIRELHKTLLLGVRGKDKQPGEFRSVQVRIGGSRFIPPPVKNMHECLHGFEAALGLQNPPYHPLVWVFLMHYQFEAIHPFRDGNGRIGRVLISLMVYRMLGLYLPWLYLSPFYEEHKSEYVDSLFACSATGNWERWIEFSLHGTIQQARDSMKRLGLLLNLSQRYHSQIDGAGTRFHAIIERLFESPVVTVPEIQKAHSVSWPTAKSDIDALVKKRVLKEMAPATRPRAYYAPEILGIAYEDLNQT